MLFYDINPHETVEL